MNPICKVSGSNDTTITHTTGFDYVRNTCYGRVIATFGKKHIWKVGIRMNKTASKWKYTIIVGVSRRKIPYANMYREQYYNDQTGYGCHCSDGYIITKGMRHSYRSMKSGVSGDVIFVTLDLRDSENGKLSFGKNEIEDFNIAFDHLDTDETYRFAVSTWRAGDSVTILSHETE